MRPYCYKPATADIPLYNTLEFHYYIIPFSSLLLCCCYALYMRYWEVIDRFITTPGFQNKMHKLPRMLCTIVTFA